MGKTLRKIVGGLMLGSIATATAIPIYFYAKESRVPEWERRISAVEREPNFNPNFRYLINNAREFYKNIDKSKLSKKELEEFENFNPNNYKGMIEKGYFKWISKDSEEWTEKDKLWMYFIHGSASDAARAIGESVPDANNPK